MIDETFEQELFSLLLRNQKQYPEMQARDVVKFLLQGMLGNGHLLSDPDRIEAHLQAELDSVTLDLQEPFREAVSPYWMRLNLRRAKAEHLTARQITRMMFLSDRICRETHVPPQPYFHRTDVYEACGRFSEQAASLVPELGIEAVNLTAQIERERPHILDPEWLPSHSDLYHELYHPAYRVLSAAWTPYLDAIRCISHRAFLQERTLVTLDGPCATGKTTLAGLLAEVFDAQVIHTDDYVVPHAMKTPQRLSVPGGNCDWERLTKELLIPWKRKQAGTYRRYDFRRDQFLEPEAFPEAPILILEGSFGNLPAIRELADVRLFLDTSYEERIRRLTKRESQQSLQGFFDKWIPLEDAYISAYGLPDEGMISIWISHVGEPRKQTLPS